MKDVEKIYASKQIRAELETYGSNFVLLVTERNNYLSAPLKKKLAEKGAKLYKLDSSNNVDFVYDFGGKQWVRPTSTDLANIFR